VIDISRNIPPDIAPLLRSSEPDFFQSPAWAAVAHALGVGRPLWFTARREGMPIAVLLAVESSILRGFCLRWPAGRIWEALNMRLFPSLDAFWGPHILTPERCSAADIVALLENAAAFAHDNGALRFRGCLNFSLPAAVQADIESLLKHGEFNISRWATFRVRLARQSEHVLTSFSTLTRRRLRLAEKMKLVARPIEPCEVNLYRDCHIRSMRAIGMLPDFWGPEYLPLLENVAPGLFRFWAVFHPDGELLAGELTCRYGSICLSISPFLSPRARQENLPAQDIMHWTAMRSAAEEGARWYDLSGVSPAPMPGSKEEGIRNFKKRWGGEYVEYLTFCKDFPHWRMHLYRRFRPAKSMRIGESVDFNTAKEES